MPQPCSPKQQPWFSKATPSSYPLNHININFSFDRNPTLKLITVSHSYKYGIQKANLHNIQYDRMAYRRLTKNR